MRKIYFAAALLCAAFWANGQSLEKCGTMHNQEYLSTLKSDYLKKRAIVEGNASTWLKEHPNYKTGVVSIPVVVHVIYHQNHPEQNIPDSLIYSQLDVLNEDYRRMNADTVNTRPIFDSVATDVQIEFCLANVDPNGDYTTGINRVQSTETNFAFAPFSNNVKSTANGGADPWPPSDYLNIWVCDMYFNGSPFVLGYAQFPGDDPATDGVVITHQHFGYRPNDANASPANLGRTGSHEVGHWLGLRHIWGDGDCTATDSIYDTPNAVEASQQICTLTNNTCDDSSDPFWGGIDPPDMLENYMDYSTDACMNLFTNGQKDRMWSFLNTDRLSLQSSTKCDGLTGLEEQIKANDIIVYPNPVNDNLKVEWPGEIRFDEIAIYNLLGEKVYHENIGNQYAKLKLNTLTLSDGVYMLNMFNEKVSVTKKVVIKH